MEYPGQLYPTKYINEAKILEARVQDEVLLSRLVKSKNKSQSIL
jgi:hypothetical protein